MTIFDFVAFFVILLVAGIVLFLAWLVLSWLYRVIFYRKHYGAVKTDKGEITNMKFTPERTWYTTTTTNGITSTHRHHEPEKNYVYIKTDEWDMAIDSDRLYQRCRIEDEVKVTYQNVYLEPRFWSGKLKKYTYRINKVLCPKDKTVDFNKTKPISHEALLVEGCVI
jgi:hypothetical protein